MTNSETTAVRSTEELLEWWQTLPEDEQRSAFADLSPAEASGLFLALDSADRAYILAEQADQQRRVWLRLLAPDDAADVIQRFPEEEHHDLLSLLDQHTWSQVEALLTYRSDVAGGDEPPLRPGPTVHDSRTGRRVSPATGAVSE